MLIKDYDNMFMIGILNTRITAFLTYLELSRVVKMTVCPINKKMSNNVGLLHFTSFF